MTYTFKNTLANSESQITKRQAEWMAAKVYGVVYGIKQIGKLADGKIAYVPVLDGRITKGANGNP